jgi:hypothetical protein
MACLLTRGRTNVCTDNIGGLKYVQFVDYGSLGTASYDGSNTDVITALSGSGTFYKYELNSTANNFTENVNTSVDNGTTYYEQVLTLSLQKLTQEDHKELKLLTWGRPHVVVTDQNDNIFIMGLENGAKVTGGSTSTGGAPGDFAGYNLTITANEKTPANWYSGSAL